MKERESRPNSQLKIKKYKLFIFIFMQVNNAGVSGGKLLNGDALLRKVALIPFQLQKIIITLSKLYLLTLYMMED
jgi:hypothetical protein